MVTVSSRLAPHRQGRAELGGAGRHFFQGKPALEAPSSEAACPYVGCCQRLLRVVQQGENVAALKLLAASKKVQLDDKPESANVRAEGFRQSNRGGGRTPRGEKIVDDDDALALLYGVFVNFEHVAAVFQLVLQPLGGSREFAGFAHRDEAGIQPVGNGGAKNESA